MAELTAPSHGGKRQPASHDALLGAGSAAALFYTALAAIPSAPTFDCPSTWTLRAPCPGCGMTRSLALCITGPIDRLVALNPVAPLVLLALACHALLWVVALTGPRGHALSLRLAPALRGLRWTAFIAVAFWGMLRICLVWSGILAWDTQHGLLWPS